MAASAQSFLFASESLTLFAALAWAGAVGVVGSAAGSAAAALVLAAAGLPLLLLAMRFLRRGRGGGASLLSEKERRAGEHADELSPVGTSAFVMTAIRAHENGKPAAARLLAVDPLAEAMMQGGATAAAATLEHYRKAYEAFAPWWLRWKGASADEACGAFVARNVFCREQLQRLLVAGGGERAQLVYLGVGMDNSSLMLGPGVLAGTTVFEVDFPETVDFRERVYAAHDAEARWFAGARRVPLGVDVTDQAALRAGLVASGFNPAKPAVFVVEGVTMYLSAEGVTALLAFLGALAAPRSALIIDFFGSSVVPTDGATAASRGANAWAAAGWARWTFGTDDPWALLAGHGWRVTEAADHFEVMHRAGRLSGALWRAAGGPLTPRALSYPAFFKIAFTCSVKQGESTLRAVSSK